MRTHGLSPKVIADLLTTIIAFVLSASVVQLDPVLAAAVSKALGTLSGIVAGPGQVTVHADDIGAPFRGA